MVSSITLQPGSHTFIAEAGETILEAALKHGHKKRHTRTLFKYEIMRRGVAMNDHDISHKTHVCIDELASLLCISEAEVLAYEKLGAIPPSEPHYLTGDARRIYPRRKALEMWAEWKSYCEFLDEEDGTNHANH